MKDAVKEAVLTPMIRLPIFLTSYSKQEPITSHVRCHIKHVPSTICPSITGAGKAAVQRIKTFQKFKTIKFGPNIKILMEIKNKLGIYTNLKHYS